VLLTILTKTPIPNIDTFIYIFGYRNETLIFGLHDVDAENRVDYSWSHFLLISYSFAYSFSLQEQQYEFSQNYLLTLYPVVRERI